MNELYIYIYLYLYNLIDTINEGRGNLNLSSPRVDKASH